MQCRKPLEGVLGREQMIKILIINTVRFKLNGISAVIKNYYQAMDKENIKMDFLAIDDPSDEYRAFFENNHLKCFVVYKKNISSYFSGIIRLCRQEKYDIVHVHGNSANMAIELLAAALGGVKHRIAHSHNTATLHPLTHRILSPLFSTLCTTRLACGEDAGKWLYRNKTFTTLKNGINVSNFKFVPDIRTEYRKRLQIGKDEILIGHVGNFIEQKNHTYLIDIFQEVHQHEPNAKLLLISDGMLFSDIKEKVRKLQLDDFVIFLGKTMEVEKYLQAIDVFLLPSLHEGLPLVLVEAQASGLPCIVSETVSKEADLIGKCKYLPIGKADIKKWVKEALDLYHENVVCNRSELSEINQNIIRDQGYDIAQNANILRQIYTDVCEE